MGFPDPEQAQTTRDIVAACRHFQVTDFGDQLACVCGAMTECSLRNTSKGDNSASDGQPSTSVGIFQQTAGYIESSGDRRMSILGAVDMFLHGGPQGQRGYLNTDQSKFIWERIQDVQGSEYDGHTAWPGRGGQVYPYAQNYKDNFPFALEAMAAIGVMDGRAEAATGG